MLVINFHEREFMKNSHRSFLWIMVLILILGIVQAQEKTRFSTYPKSSRRFSTLEEEKDKNIYLPQYDDLVGKEEDGITLENWQKFLLPKEKFDALDTNSDGKISRKELDQDDFMGSTEIHVQDSNLIRKICKEKYPDYKRRINELRKLGYKDINKKQEYILNKNIYVPKSTKMIPYEIRSETSNEVATKTYINVKDGKLIKKRVDLGSYVLLQIQDHDEQSSFTAYIFGIILIALIMAVTILIPILGQ